METILQAVVLIILSAPGDKINANYFRIDQVSLKFWIRQKIKEYFEIVLICTNLPYQNASFVSKLLNLKFKIPIVEFSDGSASVVISYYLWGNSAYFRLISK